MSPPTRWRDLAVALGLLLLVDALASLGVGGPLRVLAGALAFVAAPGYLVSVALFPEAHRVVEVASGQDEDARVRREREGLDPIERAAVAGGLGLALAAVCAFALAWTPAGVRGGPLLGLVTLASVAAAVVALLRRRGLPTERRLPTSRFALADAMPRTPRERLLAAALAVALAGLLAAGAWLAAAPREPERFTEFYVLGPGGRTEGYPERLAPGQEASLVVGIANREGSTLSYDVALRLVDGAWEGEGANRTFREGASSTSSTWRVELEDGETSEEPRVFQAPATQGPRKVVLELRRAGDAEPYRSLHLFIDVA